MFCGYGINCRRCWFSAQCLVLSDLHCILHSEVHFVLVASFCLGEAGGSLNLRKRMGMWPTGPATQCTKRSQLQTLHDPGIVWKWSMMGEWCMNPVLVSRLCCVLRPQGMCFAAKCAVGHTNISWWLSGGPSSNKVMVPEHGLWENQWDACAHPWSRQLCAPRCGQQSLGLWCYARGRNDNFQTSGYMLCFSFCAGPWQLWSQPWLTMMHLCQSGWFYSHP